jgi:hypothetical protein
MSADPLGIRPSQKGRPRSGVINRANLPPSLKGLGPPPSSSHHRSASGPSPSVGGLGRSVSLHRPNDKVNSVRYQGLAQARQFAASSSAVHVPGSVPGLSALAAQSIHDSTPHLPIVRAPEINEWRVGSAIDPSAPVRTGDRGRWDQFKGALGNLRRS